jgi:hypothetical protein
MEGFTTLTIDCQGNLERSMENIMAVAEVGVTLWKLQLTAEIKFPLQLTSTSSRIRHSREAGS